MMRCGSLRQLCCCGIEKTGDEGRKSKDASRQAVKTGRQDVKASPLPAPESTPSRKVAASSSTQVHASPSGSWVSTPKEQPKPVEEEMEVTVTSSQKSAPSVSSSSAKPTAPPSSPAASNKSKRSRSRSWSSDGQSSTFHVETGVITMEMEEPAEVMVTEQATTEMETTSVSSSRSDMTYGAVLRPPGADDVQGDRDDVDTSAQLMSPHESEIIMSEALQMESAPAVGAVGVASLDDSASVSSGHSIEYSRTQMTETEEVIETEVEETVTMMIVGVVTNPGMAEENVISLQEAISTGILDFNEGIYVNPVTRRRVPMVEAMNKGWIKMGAAKVSKTEERVKSMGIITIRTTRETMPYVVLGAKNTQTGEVLNLEEAASQGILNASSGTYKDLKSGAIMLIGDAVDEGLVDIEYEKGATGTVQEEVMKTYSVHAVVDQQARKKLPFHEAVSKGLIDKDSGEYINNLTGDKMSAEQAINKGFIKATLTDNPKALSLDEIGNKTAQRGTDAIKKKLLNPLKALKSMKK